jgi:D-galactarolactone cycloisomerase
VQPNIARTGGLSAAWEIGNAAAGAGLQVAIHHWGTPIGLSASLHLALCLPDGSLPPLVEVDRSPNPLRCIALSAFSPPEKGMMMPPSDPGLGIIPDERLMTQFHVASI